jgi:hypothetical protein
MWWMIVLALIVSAFAVARFGRALVKTIGVLVVVLVLALVACDRWQKAEREVAASRITCTRGRVRPSRAEQP